MRVCLVGPTYPYRGGISHFTQMLAREFMTTHAVQVVGFSRLYPSLLFPGRTQFDEGGELVHVEALRVIDSIDPLSWRRAARAIERFDPGVIVFQWWHSFFAPAYAGIGRSLGRDSAAPRIFLCHNVLPHESSLVDRGLARLGLATGDAFLVQSEEDRRTLAGLRPAARVAVHPHPIYSQFAEEGIDRAEARRRLGVEGRVILFFGLIRPYKGLGTLLRAFAALADPAATLLVVGEFYEDRRRYDGLIESLGIGDRVRVVGRYVPDNEVALYFRAADVAVLPYTSASGSGIAQTAFAFELPVIVTAVGGLPDVVRDGVTGFVVPPGDPAALADAIDRFFRGQWGAAFARAIRADAGRFSWSGCVTALMTLADEVRAAH